MGFWAKFVDDREKSVNPIHVIMAFIAVNAMGWVWYCLYKNSTMPELSGIAMLLGGGGVANMCQKAEDIADKVFKKKPVVIGASSAEQGTQQ